MGFGLAAEGGKAAKPHEFTGFAAMDATKPYESIGFGAMDATKLYEFIMVGAMDVRTGQSSGTIFAVRRTVLAPFLYQAVFGACPRPSSCLPRNAVHNQLF